VRGAKNQTPHEAELLPPVSLRPGTLRPDRSRNKQRQLSALIRDSRDAMVRITGARTGVRGVPQWAIHTVIGRAHNPADKLDTATIINWGRSDVAANSLWAPGK
jgi:hypothetical protein